MIRPQAAVGEAVVDGLADVRDKGGDSVVVASHTKVPIVGLWFIRSLTCVGWCRCSCWWAVMVMFGDWWLVV